MVQSLDKHNRCWKFLAPHIKYFKTNVFFLIVRLPTCSMFCHLLQVGRQTWIIEPEHLKNY